MLLSLAFLALLIRVMEIKAIKKPLKELDQLLIDVSITTLLFRRLVYGH
jgi:hypothetical protein